MGRFDDIVSAFTGTLKTFGAKLVPSGPGSTLKFLGKAETPEQAAKVASDIGRYLDSPDAVKVFESRVFLDTATVSKQNLKNIEKIRDSYKADAVLDGGKVNVGGKTFRTLAIVAGTVTLAVVLFDEDGGDAITKNIANTLTNLVEPFIPLILSSLLPLILLASSMSVVLGLGQSVMSGF